MKSWLFVGASGMVAVAFAHGCGSSAGTSGSAAGNGGAGPSGATSSGSTSSSSAGTGGGTGSSTTSSSTTGASSSSTSSSSGSAPCPDELGAYMVTDVGAGCGDLATSAPQCIQAGNATCQVQLSSQGNTGSALNGLVDLDMSGNFANGTVKEGTVQRSGCTGTWNATTGQLTVDCGGMGTTQSCIATLTRTGKTCSSSSTSSSSSGGASCPSELGAYTVTDMGAGCGDLATSAPQCIKAGNAPCQVQLSSQGNTGSALNGVVDLDTSGNFTNGAVKEGTVQRSGCTGTWNAATGQLTVDCGGMGTTQSCIATLTRTGTACP